MAIQNFLKEFWALNQLKKKGYSLIELVGNDGNIDNYCIKIGGNKKISILKKTYLINPQKRFMKDGMPIYRFNYNKAIGQNISGTTMRTAIDSNILEELIKNSRMVGSNDKGSMDQKTLIVIGVIGTVIGLLLGLVIPTLVV